MCVSSNFPKKKLWLEDFVETEALYDVYIINFTINPVLKKTLTCIQLYNVKWC